MHRLISLVTITACLVGIEIGIFLISSLVLPTSQALAFTTTTTATTSGGKSPAPTPTTSTMKPLMAAAGQQIIRIPRRVWREAALDHQQKIRSLLGPTLLPKEDVSRSNKNRRQQQRIQQTSNNAIQYNSNNDDDEENNWFTPLDPKNPVCNFLIEYYGLKGMKGPKRLARWNPSPYLLLQRRQSTSSGGSASTCIDDVQELMQASSIYQEQKKQQQAPDDQYSGILLEDVSEDDLATLLHLRGAILLNDEDSGGGSCSALYSPHAWMNSKTSEQHPQQQQQQQQPQGNNNNNNHKNSNVLKSHPASAFLWYRSILQQTLDAEPILHCHGLHEWAMQYHPLGADPPPSAKYQAHLNLRVGREIINETVERKGISCTHVDALRFFAPAAGPLNHHGASLARTDQLRLEQPACVHAQMDLLKIALRLQPFCDCELLQRVLELSMDARRLDVAASPYDATKYDVGVIPVETDEGRAVYRKHQRRLMHRAEPIRRELLGAYNLFLKAAFNEDPAHLELQVQPAKERYATAEPGGKPWRKNLISTPP